MPESAKQRYFCPIPEVFFKYNTASILMQVNGPDRWVKRASYVHIVSVGVEFYSHILLIVRSWSARGYGIRTS